MENPNWGFLVFVLLLICNLHFGTCYVDQSVQKQLDRVSNLPGQGPNFSFEHYAGYVTVNEESGRALFYWFFEAVDDPSTKPLVLWLDGGPGCSSIGLGEVEKVGPFRIEKDGKNIYWNPYSWNLAANLLFIDSPVGVGFSYSNTSSDHLNNGDKRTAADSLEFFLKWFERFPEYKERDLYLTGESYAGHYIPQLSQAIVRYNQALKKPVINLKGFMVGNPVTDDHYDYLGSFQFMWSAGMISDQTFKEAKVFCDFDSFAKPKEQCQKILDKISEEAGNVDMFSIFSPTCSDKLKRSNELGHLRRSYDPCARQYSLIYFNLRKTQKALHVHSRNSTFKWGPCSNEVMTNWKDSASTEQDIYRELIHSELRIWVLSGDTDSVVPVASTRHSINALNLPTVGPWQAWYDDGQVGGWTQEYKGLTFVTVRGAGHNVGLHRPKQTFTVFKSFLAGVSLPSFEQLSDS